jgi:hypothetical protein
MVYFGANTFIPDYLHATGQADLVGLALASLNGLQVPASVVIGLVPLPVLARPLASYAVAAATLASLVVVLTWPSTRAGGGRLRLLRRVHPGPELCAAGAAGRAG